MHAVSECPGAARLVFAFYFIPSILTPVLSFWQNEQKVFKWTRKYTINYKLGLLLVSYQLIIYITMRDSSRHTEAKALSKALSDVVTLKKRQKS